MAEHALDEVVRQVRTRLAPKASREATDRDLLERFLQQHDEAAFATLVRRHQRCVYAALTRVLRSAVPAHPGSYLAEDDDVPAYYLRSQVRWQDWSGIWYFRYGNLPAGPASYAAAIARHHFALIILDFGDTAATDDLIVADLRRSGGYRVLARAGRFTVWADQSGGARVGH